VDQSLAIELKCFHEIQNELLANNPAGGFVVIKGQDVLGVWQNRMDAIKEAVEIYGNVSFLVKNIQDIATQFINYSRPLTFSHVVSHIS
jgi:hypothetical protein